MRPASMWPKNARSCQWYSSLIILIWMLQMGINGSLASGNFGNLKGTRESGSNTCLETTVIRPT